MSETGYSDTLSESELQNIAEEFNRFKGEHYLDSAGAGLYAKSQISEVHKELSENLYLNPHTSKYTSDCVEQIRYRILQHFNTTPKEYSVVFTSGTTAGLKLTIESFSFSGNTNQNGVFAYLQDNHTSVLGMREIAAQKGAKIKCVPRDDIFNVKNNLITTENDEETCNLFVFPAQCNSTGYKYPLETIETVQNCSDANSKWYVLLDAACFAATSFLDLSKWKPDFVAISFYKIFGYPTGLGALLVKKSSVEVLSDKKYFGGGTVAFAMSGVRFHEMRCNFNERLEDGTISFLSIISLRHGFDIIERLIPGNIESNSMQRISKHVFNLARYLFYNLLKMWYENGKPVVKLYNDSEYNNENEQGGIVNFNIVNKDGSYVGFSEIEHMAGIYNIHLRTGCFCNPGACQRHLQLTDEDLRNNHKLGYFCGDENDLIDGSPTGSVRVSFGYYSTKSDVDAILNMIQECYVITGAKFENSRNLNAINEDVDIKVSKEDGKDIKMEEIKENVDGRICVVNKESVVDKLLKITGFVTNAIFPEEIPKIRNEEGNSSNSQNNANVESGITDEETNGKLNFGVTKIEDDNKLIKKEDNIMKISSESQSIDVINGKLNGDSTNIVELSILANKEDEIIKTTNEKVERPTLDSNDNCFEASLGKDFEKDVFLESICIYPVKSCGAFKVTTEWPVGPKGLLYDREWMVVTSSGVALTQKQNSKLCLIKPIIDIEKQELIFNYPGVPPHSIPLSHTTSSTTISTNSLCRSKVCGATVGATDCGAPIGVWLSSALGVQGLKLVRQGGEDERRGGRKKGNDDSDTPSPLISLANQAQYLLINKTSVQWLMQRSDNTRDNTTHDVTGSLDNYLDRFRANLIVRAPMPMEENDWGAVMIRDVQLKVDGPCARCQIICIDQQTGLKSSEPLRVIANEFHGKRTFGVYLSLVQSEIDCKNSVIKCGKTVRIRNSC